MVKPLVIANWKMYVESPDAAKNFARKLRRATRQFAGVDVALAPAFPLIPAVAQALKGSNIRVLGQALSPFTDDQRTGEVSARMLMHAGASGAIVGHSERRALGESDEAVAQELAAADEAGLRAVLCVGEPSRDESGAYFATVAKQLRTALAVKPSAKLLVVAYEPVWAIGKSAAEAMRPMELEEMVIYIRKILAESMGRTAALKIPVLYGGSVEPSNAKELLEGGGASGLLVGHASAEYESFLEILRAVRPGSR